MSLLLTAVGCSRSVQWEGIDKNATWDFHAKYQSTPFEPSSLVRPDKALEEHKSNAGSKSARKQADRPGSHHLQILHPQRSWISPWKWELGSGLGSPRCCGCLDNTVYPIFPARCSGISCGTNGLLISQRGAEFSTHSSHTSLRPRHPQLPLFV